MLYSGSLDETELRKHTGDIWWANSYIMWQHQCDQYFKESSVAFQDEAYSNQVPFCQSAGFGQCRQVRVCTNNRTTTKYLHQTSSDYNFWVSSSAVGHCFSSSLDSSFIFISYSSSASIFISFSLHQLQPSFFFSIQLLLASYPLPLMPKGERCSCQGERCSCQGELTLRGSLLSVAINDKGGDCWSVWALHGLFESCVCHWCQLSPWLWSCPWFRPFVEPLMSVFCCGVWETFSSDSSPSLKPFGVLEMSQKPLWVCVWSPIIILLFLMTNSLIFP